MVPDGWEKRDLQGLVAIKHGFAFKSEFFTSNGDLILLTPGSFYESGGFRDQGEKTKYYYGEVPDGYLLNKGDMLLAMTEQAEGLLGSALFVPENDRYLHNQRLGLVQIIQPNRVCLEFLYLFFNAPFSRKQITEQSTGTKVKHTSPDRLCSVVGLIPPLPEQKKIAQILSTWDKAITTTEQLLANSQQQKKALMQQLLTGKKRLLDENGVRFSGEWMHYKFGNVFKERVEVGRVDLPLLSITADEGVVYQEDTGRKNTSNEDKSKYRRICVDDIGYNTMRMWQGRSSLSDKEGIVSPAYTIVTPTDNICPTFAAYLFKLPALIHVFYRHSQGLVSDTWNLKFNHFKKISWQLPGIEEQRKIAAVLSITDREITALQQKLDGLKQEKKALMQQLLTGKRRVTI
ncbi:restriction endonuclease subunit S [Ketobacter sp.]|uniref:restriction endonuclease subunit S n=1 Tax=Ketobacter sp. TaxID=2083498 RepID=UPI000F25F1FB|nr:restriction endonuclease subunit S [Ketobacter sp.]RLU00189.1 MAG: restriction endonuclease subunit S [Ketobacter sp.]